MKNTRPETKLWKKKIFKLLLLAKAIKTILTPSPCHPRLGSLISGKIMNPSTWNPEEFTRSKWLSCICVVCFFLCDLTFYVIKN